MQVLESDNPLICYAVPGLGATGEIFSRLVFPPSMELHPIAWESELPDESVKDYARRLLPQIDQTRKFILLGCSFGSTIALELSNLLNPVLTVVVSGVAAAGAVPINLRLLHGSKADRMVQLAPFLPKFLLSKGCSTAFGTKDPAALELLTSMIQNTSPKFGLWALGAMAEWRGNYTPSQYLSIHGGRDRLIPARCVNPDLLIDDGGHFIIYTHGTEIGQAIVRKLEALPIVE